jgi:hypothetical protein
MLHKYNECKTNVQKLFVKTRFISHQQTILPPLEGGFYAHGIGFIEGKLPKNKYFIVKTGKLHKNGGNCFHPDAAQQPGNC